jgi:hypothetical protein
MPISQRMTFRRIGRSRQLRIRCGEDLAHIPMLDEAHWVATSAPVSSINGDATFLRLVDADNNGRITCAEVIRAVCWLLSALRDLGGAAEGSTSLRLAAIDTACADGQRAHLSARKILDRLGLSEAEEITLDQVREVKARVEPSPVSEAGVVLPEATGDAEVRRFLTDIVAATGGAPHPSGAKGVSQAELDRFLADARAYLDWHQRGQIPSETEATEVMPLAAETPQASALLASLRPKIDQYFAQCEALALDERFAQRMGWTDAELAGLDFDDATVIETVLSQAPLAKARPDRELSFDEQINPFYAEKVEQFRRQVVAPALGESVAALSARQWQEVKSFFEAHKEWVESQSGRNVAPLGTQKLRSYLDERFSRAVQELIAESSRTAFDLDNIRLTEKLVLYQAHMVEFANNFVSFPHLYDTAKRALFEMGTLVMDGRRFNLAVRVDGRAEHARVARTSNFCLLYVEVSTKAGEVTCEVAVPVTSGSKGNLCVGKRGVFQDLAGRELDARVVEVVENPISVREAICSPFQRLWRMISGKIEAIGATAEKQFDTRASAAMETATAGTPPQPAAPAASRSLLAGGLLMGGGVAVAALASAVAYIGKALWGVPPWKILLGVAIAILAVILPTSMVAILKLRKRDLSAVLEGSGWAINACMRLTSKQGRFFTRRPKYPDGARGVGRVTWRRLLGVAIFGGAVVAGVYLFRWLFW